MQEIGEALGNALTSALAWVGRHKRTLIVVLALTVIPVVLFVGFTHKDTADHYRVLDNGSIEWGVGDDVATPAPDTENPEATAADACENRLLADIDALTTGKMTPEGIAFKYGSQSPEFHEILNDYTLFRSRGFQVGAAQASSEVLGQVRTYCEVQYETAE